MRIANWSIPGITSPKPSLRQDRQRRLLEWLEKSRPRIDVVALQKVGLEAEFPRSALREIGYRSAAYGPICGEDFGVAVLSRRDLPAAEVRFQGLPCPEASGARLLTVDIGRLRFSSIYAPFGNPRKYGKKRAIERRVAWLRCLRAHVCEEGYGERQSLLCGDFNVKTKSDGPPEGDLYTEAEQNELEELLNLGFVDLYDEYRRNHPDAGKGCTFYFTGENPKGASRLHLAIASTQLAKGLQRARVDVEFAIRKKAAPLIVDLDYCL